VQQQQNENGALPALAKLDRATSVADLERSQQAIDHAANLLTTP